MAFTAKDCSWESIRPIVRFWILAPHIQNLENFLRQIKNLTEMEAISMIWQMVQPDFFSGITEIHVMLCHCVHISSWLTAKQTTMQQGELYAIDRRSETIKRRIKETFEDNEGMMPALRVMRLIMRLIRSAPGEIVAELVYHYEDIWQNTDFNDCTVKHVTAPRSPSGEERAAEASLLRNNPNLIVQMILVMHERLVDQIMAYRQRTMDELVRDVEERLVFLRQQQLRQ